MGPRSPFWPRPDWERGKTLENCWQMVVSVILFAFIAQFLSSFTLFEQIQKHWEVSGADRTGRKILKRVSCVHQIRISLSPSPSPASHCSRWQGRQHGDYRDPPQAWAQHLLGHGAPGYRQYKQVFLFLRKKYLWWMFCCLLSNGMQFILLSCILFSKQPDLRRGCTKMKGLFISGLPFFAQNLISLQRVFHQSEHMWFVTGVFDCFSYSLVTWHLPPLGSSWPPCLDASRSSALEWRPPKERRT